MWTWSVVTVKSRQDFHKLNIRTFQLIRKLAIGDRCSANYACQWTAQDWVELFNVLVNLPTLTKIRPIWCFWYRSTDLSCVEPGLLLSVYKRLEEVHLYSQLSSDQSELLFSAIAESKCSLRVLRVGDDSTTTLGQSCTDGSFICSSNYGRNTTEEVKFVFLQHSWHRASTDGRSCDHSF